MRIAIAAGLLAAACAGSTDPVAMGDGTYMLANHGVMGWSSGPAQKAKAIERASEYCGAQGRRFELLSATEQPGGFGQIAAGEVQFRCMELSAK